MRYLILDRNSGLRATAWGVLFATGFLLAVLIGLHLADHSPGAVFRGPSMSDGPEAGLISNFGLFLMVVAGAISLLRAITASSLPLAIFGVFCCLFALDDHFVIHGLSKNIEIAMYVAYGATLSALIWIYHRASRQLPYPLLAGLAAFAVSAGVDLVWSAATRGLLWPEQTLWYVEQIGLILEDVPKFVGIALMFSFSIGESGWGSKSAAAPG